jgi:hypothetical protein
VDEEELEETIVIIIQQHTLYLELLLEFYQCVDVFLNLLGLPEGEVVRDDPAWGECYLR